MPSSSLNITAILAVGALVIGGFGRDAHAEAPAGHYVVTDETVFDRFTKLTWQRVVPDPAVPFTWTTAIAFCGGLNLAHLSGWRLPSVKELDTIIDDSRFEPAIDLTAFPNTPNEPFWTSSPKSGDPSMAWMVNFDHGFSYPVPLDSPNRVRCVR
jgi:hypothetical protein